MNAADWTELGRVHAVVRATGCSIREAVAYLIAEEGDIDDAVISCRGDMRKSLARFWIVRQGSSKGRIAAADYAAAAERARAIGFARPDSIVLDDGGGA